MDRRPLKSRDRGWARALASLLVRWRIRPNAISIFSIVFALGAGAALIASRNAEGIPRVGLLIAAAAGIQLRLLCNLFDGMVAVEGKMASKTGDIFNELPDRIADPLIIVSAGYAIVRFYTLGPTLGWCAGLLAVMTAYVRVLAGSVRAKQDFCGPMAKQHRMATLTLAIIVDAIAGYLGFRDYTLMLALIMIIVGTIVTMVRRTRRMAAELESR
ncbi:MAG TPA: CDP-alcohol phosphatidyltransferase family protein [Thermoanaerobaculia bacterium]|jgi:phosphatidylglycerophosphate synthase|nr:CDP-alcohol phosphatidyltransferase family protein [Thermoanaerobaculia bacterium]